MLRFILFLLAAISISATAAEPNLFAAVANGDRATVERLIAAGTPPDSLGRNAETPLMAAVLAGQVEIARFLLDHGADVMAANKGGYTPLHAAAYAGSVPAAILLLECPPTNTHSAWRAANAVPLEDEPAW